jgi:Plasmid encoded RepA protein
MEQGDDQSILYQHTVLCQTCLPYRDPGDDVREWERTNGDMLLEVSAGKIAHHTERRFVKFGLPFGPKCRLVLMAINQLAIVKQSPHIEVEDSLTAFVRRVLNLDPKGRNIRQVKDQLQRLTAADITLGRVADSLEGTASQTRYFRVVEGFDVWLPKDENQRVLWSSVIDLSEK